MASLTFFLKLIFSRISKITSSKKSECKLKKKNCDEKKVAIDHHVPLYTYKMEGYQLQLVLHRIWKNIIIKKILNSFFKTPIIRY